MAGSTKQALHVQRDMPVPMRDGVILRADVYTPRGARSTSPVIVQRTPYDKTLYDAFGQMFAERGYAYVVQDVRGQFASDGVFDPWVNEAADGYDTVEWAAQLPGTSRRVGLFGSSYQGFAAWLAASLAPPHLGALATSVTPSDVYDDWVWPSGAFSLAFNLTWVLNNVGATAASRLADGEAIAARMRAAYAALPDGGFLQRPLEELAALCPGDDSVAPYFFEWLRHADRDDYWADRSLVGRYGGITVPTLQISGWYDVFCAGTIRNFERMGKEGRSLLARNARRLVIGPWKHNQWGTRLGDVDFGPEAADLLVDEVIGWFDRWLRDNGDGCNEEPHVRAFLMGENRWRSSATWPPSTTSLELFLGPDGRLDRRPANCSRDRVSFSYDPANPVPSVGGQSCCYDPAPMGPRDQRAVEQREDVLVFSTPPLREPVTVVGQPTLALRACSSAEDTDFTAKLIDVHPEGLAINLTEGIVRAQAARPGRVHEYEIVLRPTFATFAAGHAIRVEVSSSNFPAYERNPVPALQTVLFGAAHPSRLILGRI